MRAAWSGLKRGTPNPVICGRKFCSHCGRWRLVAVDFELVRRGRRLRFRSYCRTCQRLSNRASTRRLVNDARRLALRREYQRIWAEGKRRQDGVPARAFNDSPSNPRRRRTAVDRPERVLLPLEPLLQALVQVPETELSVLARRAGITPRTIYRYRYGESQHVRIDVADKLAVAMGTTSSLIWGEMW